MRLIDIVPVVDLAVEDPAHHVTAYDVAIDQRGCAACAEKCLVGRGRVGLGRAGRRRGEPGQETVVEMVEQRRELGQDRMIVVALVGDHDIGQPLRLAVRIPGARNARDIAAFRIIATGSSLLTPPPPRRSLERAAFGLAS